MKKYFYIGAFMFLGWLTSMLAHGLIEIPLLGLITGERGYYGNNIIWQNWRLVHGLGGFILSLGGVLLGFFLGRKFWQVLYVEKRYGEPWW